MSNIRAALQRLASCAVDSEKSIEDLNVDAVQDILVDLCTECRAARCSDALSNELDSWEKEKLSDIIVPDQMIRYLSKLIELGTTINPKDPNDLRLSLISSSAYILLLTVPGAKGVGVFDVNLVGRTLKMDHLLKVMPELRHGDRNNIFIHCVLLLKDIQILLRHVPIGEEENLKTEIVHCMTLIMLHFHGKMGKCEMCKLAVFILSL